MLDSISSFVGAVFWPLPHIFSTIRLTGSESPPELKALPFLRMPGHMAILGGSIRSFLYAYFIVYGLYEGDNYPAFGRAYTWSWQWMWPIIARNIIGTWLLCGFWDYWLYFGPLKEKLFKYKIVPKYPSMAQMKHDLFYTTMASCLAAFLEIAMCHCWAIGLFPMSRSLFDKPLVNFGLGATIRHWRAPHFYSTHRAIHPWRTNNFPDLGKILYRYVHHVHHKSYNITAFSGTNMHPIEAAIYYSAALMCVPFGAHPTVAIGCIVDLGMAAWIGHDGHVYPGAGDYYHTLHHIHFDCNYGNPQIPFDLLNGTYAGCKEDLKKIWGKTKYGVEGNEGNVHGDSKSNSKVA